jgi:hypothetical protein
MNEEVMGSASEIMRNLPSPLVLLTLTAMPINRIQRAMKGARLLGPSNSGPVKGLQPEGPC